MAMAAWIGKKKIQSCAIPAPQGLDTTGRLVFLEQFLGKEDANSCLNGNGRIVKEHPVVEQTERTNLVARLTARFVAVASLAPRPLDGHVLSDATTTENLGGGNGIGTPWAERHLGCKQKVVFVRFVFYSNLLQDLSFRMRFRCSV